MRFPAALEAFTFTFHGGSNSCGCIETDVKVRVLLSQRQSFNKIEIRGYRDLRGEDGNAINRSILKNFHALEEFGMPIKLLLFDDGTTLVTMEKLVDVLPPSFVKLTLYGYDDCSIAVWGKTCRSSFRGGISAVLGNRLGNYHMLTAGKFSPKQVSLQVHISLHFFISDIPP